MDQRSVFRRVEVLSRAAQVEAVERRLLLSLAPAGAEFCANTFATSEQSTPAVASDADGDFVVAWQGNGSGDGNGIFAQRYDASGVAQGSEFRVNTTTALNQRNPAVAMDADGDFVVAWESTQAGTYDVFAQRFNAAGAPQGGEFRVNTFTTSDQLDASIAIDASGDFAIAWASLGQEGASNRGIYAQRYNASGVAQDGELHVNTVTANNQLRPAAAMDADGDFIVTWLSFGTYGVFAQRYNVAGAAQGGQIQLTGIVDRHAIAMDAAGNFVLTWDLPDGSGQGVFACRFNAVGVAQGSEFPVNTVTANSQQSMSVAMDSDGDFLITWESDAQDGSSHGVYGQSFNSLGAPQGSEFRINTFTTNRQRFPAVAMDADGDAIVAWQSLYQDSANSYGVYAQRYGESNADTASPVVGGLFVNLFPSPEPAAPGQRVDFVTSLVISFSEDMSVAGGAIGANSAANKANYRLMRNGVDVSSVISSASFSFNSTTRRYQTTLSLPFTGLASGSYVITVLSKLRDPAGNTLDGDFDGAPGGDFTRAFAVVQPVKVGPEFRVNVTTSLDQFVPAVAMDAAGNFVVVWRSEDQDGSFDGIYGRRYSAAGISQSAEFRINAVTTNFQRSPVVARQGNGDFVVAWSGFGPGDTSGVFARRYNANGLAKDGIEFRVNTFTTSIQDAPALAMDSVGNFVIAWSSFGQDGDSDGIYAQRYNAAGVPLGSEFRVNTTTTDAQNSPSVAMDSDGDFVIVWNGGTVDHYEVFAQRYNAADVPQGVEFRVGNTPFNQFSTLPAVAMDADGDFVVAWENSLKVDAQRFNAAGVALGSQFTVDTNRGGRPSIVCDADGNFIVAWNSQFDTYEVYARRYNAAGVDQSGRFQVNTFTTAIQGLAAVSMDADGDFVIAWESYAQDGSGYGIYAQRYARLTEVNVSSFLFETAPHRLQFTFNDNVSATLGTNDIVLENLTTSTTIPSSDLAVTFDAAANVATFSYTGNASGIAGVLPDGNYRAILIAAGITNPGGTPLAADHVFSFFFQNGDANRDRVVDISDLGILATNWQGTGKTFSQGDFSYDGTVDITDLGMLATNWQKQLALPSAPSLHEAGAARPKRLIEYLAIL